MKMSDDMQKRIEQAAAVLKAAGAREVYIFGSAAQGKMREDSDIDFAVSGLPPKEFFSAMGRAEDVLGHSLDLIDLDEQNLFTDYLKKKGKLLRVA